MKSQSKTIVSVLLALTALVVSGCEKSLIKEDTILIKEDAIVFDDWVDLGLPSGILWASRNVGATSPEKYGDYIAWGETRAKSGSHDWSTYQYTQYSGWQYLFTKYCYDPTVGYDGYTDTLTILQPEDDAATACYGGRTPTKGEWQELMDNTTVRDARYRGVGGLYITGTNGNSIFLPYTGCPDNSYSGGCDGHYWTSSLCTAADTSTGVSEIYHAWYIELASYDIYKIVGQVRFMPHSIRAVRFKQGNADDRRNP